MEDQVFLNELADRLERISHDQPNLNLHWSDIARLRMAASTLEAQEARLRGIKRALDAATAQHAQSRS